MPERPGELIYAQDETPPWPHLLARFPTRRRHLPLSGDGGAGRRSREIAAPRGAKRHWPRHDRGCLHDGSPKCAAGTGGFGLSLSAGRLGHLSAVEPGGGRVVRLAGRLRHGDLRRACEIAVASLINRTRKLFPAVVSGVVIIAVGMKLGRIGASVLFQHAAAHSDTTTASFATAAFALGTDRPRGLGQGIAQAVLLAPWDSCRIRRDGGLPYFSAELLHRLRGGPLFRDP